MTLPREALRREGCDGDDPDPLPIHWLVDDGLLVIDLRAGGDGADDRERGWSP